MPTDPREMRKEINELGLGRRSWRDDGGPFVTGHIGSSMIVRQVQDCAFHVGLSGEDHMTMLAYHALKAYDRALAQLNEFILTMPAPMIITPASPPAPKPEG